MKRTFNHRPARKRRMIARIPAMIAMLARLSSIVSTIYFTNSKFGDLPEFCSGVESRGADPVVSRSWSEGAGIAGASMIEPEGIPWVIAGVFVGTGVGEGTKVEVEVGNGVVVG
jgi:hypothetical protein